MSYTIECLHLFLKMPYFDIHSLKYDVFYEYYLWCVIYVHKQLVSSMLLGISFEHQNRIY